MFQFQISQLTSTKTHTMGEEEEPPQQQQHEDQPLPPLGEARRDDGGGEAAVVGVVVRPEKPPKPPVVFLCSSCSTIIDYRFLLFIDFSALTNHFLHFSFHSSRKKILLLCMLSFSS
jgi:hypothetical protein